MRASQHIDAAVFDGAKLAQGAKWVKRGFALGLIGLIVAGTYVQVNGGAWVWPQTWGPVLTALGWQATVTAAQFMLRAQWASIWYFAAVALSAGPSVLSYGAILHSGWAAGLVGMGAELEIADAAAWVLLAVVFIIADIIPEQILVRHKGAAGAVR